MECEICEIVKKQEHCLLTTDHWRVFLALDQGYLGRSYVTIRDHKGSLAELSDEEWAEYKNIVRRMEKAYRKAFGAELFNWACMGNDAYQADDPRPHLHWHFRPRYLKAVTVGDLTFEDPEFGHHYDRNQRKRVDNDTFQLIYKKIKSEL